MPELWSNKILREVISLKITLKIEKNKKDKKIRFLRGYIKWDCIGSECKVI